MPANQAEFQDYVARNPTSDWNQYLRAYGYEGSHEPVQQTYDNGTQTGRTTAPNNNDAKSPDAFASYEEWLPQWLIDNPGDIGRSREAYGSGKTGSGHDAQDPSYVPGSRMPGSSSGTAPVAGTPNTTATSNGQLSQLLDLLKGMNQQPDVDLSGVTVSDIPQLEVPGQNLSPYIDQTLINGMEGDDPLDLFSRLRDLLDRTSGGGVNSQRLAQRTEQAREQLTRGEESSMADLRSVLADRGLLGLPGSPSGVEGDMTSRAFLPLQREFLSNVRQATVDEQDKADAEEIDALTQATGWSKDMAASRLAAADAAGGRQQMMANIALQSLAQNADWNKFLATFGLQREQVEADIRNGKIANLLPVLQMFMGLIAQSRGGAI